MAHRRSHRVPAASISESAEHLAKILEVAEDAVVSTSEDQRIVFFNHSAEKMFGYTAAEILGRTLETLIPVASAEVHRQYVTDFARSAVRARNMGERGRIRGRRSDGTEFPAEASISKIDVHGSWIFTAIVRDVTDREHAEQKIKTSLAEKELLLKEIHHRVKNNLQVISSLLGLQSRGAADDLTRRVLQESQNRIHAMALLHESLYKSSNLAAIDCGEYIREISSYLFRSFGVNADRISLVIDVDQIEIDMDTAIPIGLILNELLSNCLKYAFPDGATGEIEIGFREGDNGAVALRVKDDGCGIPPTVDLPRAKTLGWRLVRTLADQLDATVNVQSRPGTDVRVEFKPMKLFSK